MSNNKEQFLDEYKDITITEDLIADYFGRMSQSIKSWSTKSTTSAFFELGIREQHADEFGYAPITVDKRGTSHIVTSFIDPNTGLTVMSDGTVDANAKFEHLYKDACFEQGLVHLSKVRDEAWFNDANRNGNRYYKTYRQIEEELAENWNYPSHVKKAYLKYLSGITNYSIMDQAHRINQFISYEIDSDKTPRYNPKYRTTRQLPITNPMMLKTLKHTNPSKWREIDNVISVFFKDDSKIYFNTYIGAAFSNVTLKELGKMLVIKSVSGAGKSTLTDGLSAILDNYSETYPDFDDFFRLTSRFARSQFKNKRVLFYDEANWGEDHAFSGLDESAIKSFVTDGIYRTEAKYQDQRTLPISALQVVCTNYIPKLTTDSAMDRRLLLIRMDDSSMIKDKAPQLPGTNQEEFVQWWVDNQADIVRYFVDFFKEHSDLIQTAPGFTSRNESKPLPKQIEDEIDLVETESNETLQVLRDTISEAIDGYLSPYAQVVSEKGQNHLLVSITRDATEHFGDGFDLFKSYMKNHYEQGKRRINKVQQRCLIIPL